MPVLRMFPLNTVVFPGQDVPLHIFEPRYQQLVREVLDEDAEFGIALIREGRAEGGGAVPVDVGCAVHIVEAEELPGGRWEIACEGTRRFRIRESLGEDPFLRCDVEFLEDPADSDSEATVAAMAEVRTAYSQHLQLTLGLVDSWQRAFPLPPDPAQLGDLVAGRMEIPAAVKQEILEAPEIARRLEMLIKVLEVENAQLVSRLEAHRRVRYAGLGILN